MPMRLLVLFLMAVSGLPALAGECTARSGERTAALVELYTSEGCSSCPPADRWLSTLGERYPAGQVVPLSLHVDYWDYIGWKDPYAKREFTSRQRKLTQLQKNALVYTPQVMLQGQDFRRWGTRAFDEEVLRISARPAGARLGLTLHDSPSDALEVEATVELVDPRSAADAVLYLAAYESKLASRVTAGENRGSTLLHDYVVLEWQGPYSVGPGTAQTVRKRLPLLPKAVPAHSGAVAFVQNRSSGEVLQALMRPACPT